MHHRTPCSVANQNRAKGFPSETLNNAAPWRVLGCVLQYCWHLFAANASSGIRNGSSNKGLKMLPSFSFMAPLRWHGWLGIRGAL